MSPQEIRQTIVNRLIAQGVAGGNVCHARARPFARGDVPVVTVFSAGSDSTGRSSHIAELETTERMTIAGTVVLDPAEPWDDIDEALADAIDALEAEIKAAVFGYRPLIAALRRLQGVTSAKGGTVDGDDIRGQLVIEIRYLRDETWDPEGDTADPDLERVTVRARPAGGTGDAPQTEVRPIWTPPP
ncbi:MAG: hypothetical protein PVJ64_00250 [Gemmatimonadales bacterium]